MTVLPVSRPRSLPPFPLPPSGSTLIPNCLMRVRTKPRLSSDAMTVYWRLLSVWQAHQPWPTRAALAQWWAGWPPSRVNRALHELTRKGLLDPAPHHEVGLLAREFLEAVGLLDEERLRQEIAAGPDPIDWAAAPLRVFLDD